MLNHCPQGLTGLCIILIRFCGYPKPELPLSQVKAQNFFQGQLFQGKCWRSLAEVEIFARNQRFPEKTLRGDIERPGIWVKRCMTVKSLKEFRDRDTYRPTLLVSRLWYLILKGVDPGVRDSRGAEMDILAVNAIIT
jgi:hypothetical protein